MSNISSIPSAFQFIYSDVLGLTVSFSLLLYAIYLLFPEIRHYPGRIFKAVLQRFFSIVKSIPYVRNQIETELKKVRKDLYESIHAVDNTNTRRTNIPHDGESADEIIRLSQIYNELETPRYQQGRVSGAVFSSKHDAEEMKMYKAVFENYAYSNPLWPKLFPGVRKMEAEVVRMTCNLLKGDDDTCGTMTTGGSMSILLACLAHRNRAYSKGVRFPEMILPTSAHAAFYKAAELFELRVIEVPLDPVTFTVDVKRVEKAICSQTALVVASAPNFPYGTIDDVVSLGNICSARDIPLHIDACLGGFLLPFLDSEKYQIPPFGFDVAGVSSISADTHKYALTPKGSSVICYRNSSYLHHQYYCQPNWQGGIYASATLEGSRSGLNIALTWSALLFHGCSSYSQKSMAVVDTTRKLRDGIAAIPELRLQGASDVCIVSFTSDVIDIYLFHEMMNRLGWQLSALQFPSGVHLMVTLLHTQCHVASDFIEDCQKVVRSILSNPSKQANGISALYKKVQSIPDRSIVSDFAYAYLDVCYSLPNKDM